MKIILEKNYSKLILTLSILVLGNSLFATEDIYTESWMSLGYENGYFMETTQNNDIKTITELKSPGINFSAYTFDSDSNVGYFASDSFLFPNSGTIEINGDKSTFDLSIYDVIAQIGIVIGPAYRNEISDDLFFKAGIGFSLFEFVASNEDLSILAFNLGIGGDIGIKYDISDTFYFDLGTKWGYDSYNWTSVKTAYGNASATASDYMMLRIAPYIGFGINFYRAKNNLGKS